MKKLIAAFIALLPFSLSAQSNLITLEDIWVKNRFLPKGIEDLRSKNDGIHYTINVGGHSIEEYSYETGERIGELFHVSQTGGVVAEFVDYQFNSDETMILLTTSQVSRYRWSTYDENYVYDLKSHKTTRLSDRGKQMYANFSPVGNSVAYVIDNNLYYKDISTNTEYQLTEDGKWKYIINGGSDWVYEEEFTFTRAFQWSPDGKKIAYYKFDESEVPEFDLTMYDDALYPRIYEYKYPKVGEKNSKVSIYIYDISNRSTVRVNIGKAYEYIPRIQWTDNGSMLCVFTLNRLQNDLELFLADPGTGNTRSMYRETSSTYIGIGDSLIFLPDHNSFLWESEQDGWAHIYRYDLSGKMIQQITKGNWEVAKLMGYDAEREVIYYTSTEDSPYERQLYSIRIDGTGKKKLTKRMGSNSGIFSKGFQYFINTNSNFIQPPIIELCDASGKIIRVLEDNAKLQKDLLSLQLSTPEYFRFPVGEGTELFGYLIKPQDFDPKKKYPVLMYVYGGPGSQSIVNSYDYGKMKWHQMLAQKGYIVACVDNRGTGGRGRDFRTITYGQLGKFETDDQIAAARWLSQQSYVDGSRIGIWGWSYGGYMAGLCITRGADVFKAAISVAPVTNWKFYDDIYTERYMGTLETNPNGFDDNAPMAFADLLKGKYLIIHGTGDDNVHFQNSIELIDALIANNKQFELMIYPDKQHSIKGGNTRLHLYTRMTNFIMENL